MCTHTLNSTDTLNGRGGRLQVGGRLGGHGAAGGATGDADQPSHHCARCASQDEDPGCSHGSRAGAPVRGVSSRCSHTTPDRKPDIDGFTVDCTHEHDLTTAPRYNARHPPKRLTPLDAQYAACSAGRRLSR